MADYKELKDLCPQLDAYDDKVAELRKFEFGSPQRDKLNREAIENLADTFERAVALQPEIRNELDAHADRVIEALRKGDAKTLTIENESGPKIVGKAAQELERTCKAMKGSYIVGSFVGTLRQEDRYQS